VTIEADTSVAAGKSKARGRYASSAARQDQIVRAALASFAEHGFDRASLRDIASRAGVTHAALLRHFAGKEELLVAALDQRDDDDELLARRIMESKVPAEKVLSSVLQEEFAHPDHQRNWLSITIAATNPAHPAHDFFVARRRRMRKHFTSGRLAGLDGDETLTDEEKVTLITAMIDGLRIQALFDPAQDVLPLSEKFLRLISNETAAGTAAD